MAEPAEVKTEQYYRDAARALEHDPLIEDFGAVQGSLASVIEHSEVLDPVSDVHEKAKNEDLKIHDREIRDNNNVGNGKASYMTRGLGAAYESDQAQSKQKEKEKEDLHRLLRTLEEQIKEWEGKRDYWHEQAEKFGQMAEKAEALLAKTEEIMDLQKSGEWEKLSAEERASRLKEIGLDENASALDVLLLHGKTAENIASYREQQVYAQRRAALYDHLAKEGKEAQRQAIEEDNKIKESFEEGKTTFEQAKQADAENVADAQKQLTKLKKLSRSALEENEEHGVSSELAKDYIEAKGTLKQTEISVEKELEIFFKELALTEKIEDPLERLKAQKELVGNLSEDAEYDASMSSTSETLFEEGYFDPLENADNALKQHGADLSPSGPNASN